MSSRKICSCRTFAWMVLSDASRPRYEDGRSSENLRTETSKGISGKARLLEQENEESGWMMRSFGKLIGLATFGPLIATIPFVWKFIDEGVENIWVNATWLGLTVAYNMPLQLPLMLRAFAKVRFSFSSRHVLCQNNSYISVPHGIHTLCLVVKAMIWVFCATVCLRLVFGNRIVPYGYFLNIFHCSFRSYDHLTSHFSSMWTNEMNSNSVQPRFDAKLPKSIRFSPAHRKRIESLGDIMGFLLLLLCRIRSSENFLSISSLVQAFLVPCFFLLSSHRLQMDNLIMRHVSSDA